MDAKKGFTEILEILSEWIHEPAGRGAGYGFYIEDQESAFDRFKEMMEEYAKQKCLEQKEICQQYFLDTKGYEDIKSAPLATDK